MRCALCDRELKNYVALATHLRFNHELSNREYYDAHIHLNLPVCKCGKEKKFRGLGEGYRDTCLKCRPSHSGNIGKKQSQDHIDSRLRKIDQASKERRRRQTMVERYGVTNPSSMPDHFEKCRVTCLSNHGVDHISRSKDHINGRWKLVDFDGRRLKVQGYEDVFLKRHEQFGFVASDIIHGKKNCPSFKWHDAVGIEHTYFPDFFSPSTNTVIEIKSRWTYESNIDAVERKLKSVRDAGYNVFCVVFASERDLSPKVLN